MGQNRSGMIKLECLVSKRKYSTSVRCNTKGIDRQNGVKMLLPDETTWDEPPIDNVTDARIAEIMRVAVMLDAGDLTLEALDLHITRRLNELYPPEYVVYRGRWEERWYPLLQVQKVPIMMGYLDWMPLWKELAALTNEGSPERVAELRELLLLDGWTSDGDEIEA